MLLTFHVDGRHVVIGEKLDVFPHNAEIRGKAVLIAVIDRLTEGRTAFIVAHRLSTVLGADEILVMRSGSIVERGTHKSLMEKHGFYYELYQSQFKQGQQI